MELLQPTEINFTPQELAEIKKVHAETIRKLFKDEPGVLRFGHPATGRRRQRFFLRIPKSVADRVFKRLTVGNGEVA